MTERTPPAWLQSGTYPAEDDRRLLNTLFGDSEGIITSTDLAVTQRGAGANMSVDVAGGRCTIKGDLGTYEGTYHMENRGTTNLVIAASDPTNPRIDRVIAEVLNQEYSGVSNLWRLRVITGTPAGAPVAPALPSNAISLATVSVAALAASVVNANITDTRGRAYLMNSNIVCTSTTRPASPFGGMEIFETDTQLKYIYSATAAAWVLTENIGAWTTYTPSLTQSGAVTKTVTYAKYIKQGRLVTVNGLLSCTGAGSAGIAVSVGLPLTAAAVTNTVVGSGMIFDASAGTFYAGVAGLASSTTIYFYPGASGANVLGAAGFTAALANTDLVAFSASYEATS